MDMCCVCGYVRVQMGAQGLVDALYDASTQELTLAGYTEDGDLLLVGVQAASVGAPAVLRGGHSSVIRSVERVGGSVLLSSGEDGKVCAWGRGFAPAAAAAAAAAASPLKHKAPHVGGAGTGFHRTKHVKPF